MNEWIEANKINVSKLMGPSIHFVWIWGPTLPAPIMASLRRNHTVPIAEDINFVDYEWFDTSMNTYPTTMITHIRYIDIPAVPDTNMIESLHKFIDTLCETIEGQNKIMVLYREDLKSSNPNSPH